MDVMGFEPTIIGTLRLWIGVSHPYFYELHWTRSAHPYLVILDFL